MPGLIVSNTLRFYAMPLLVPGPDTPALRTALSPGASGTWLVACFCAAWCDTCGQYRPRLAALAEAQPQRVYAWIDIEDQDRKSVVEGKSVSVRVDLGGSRIIKKKKKTHDTHCDNATNTNKSEDNTVIQK